MNEITVALSFSNTHTIYKTYIVGKYKIYLYELWKQAYFAASTNEFYI
jgi:hypothetical protein